MPPSLQNIRFTDLQVVAVEPSELIFGVEATLTLRGSSFVPGCSFALVNEYGATIPLTGAEVVDATMVRIPAAVAKWPGWFDLTVTSPDGVEGARLRQAIQVKQALPPSQVQTILSERIAIGKPVALPSSLPFVGISAWPKADRSLLPPLLVYVPRALCFENLSLCLSTMTTDGPGSAWLEVESDDSCFSFVLKGGPGVELYDLHTRPLSSIGNGFLWWARSILDKNTLPAVDGPQERFGPSPVDSIYVQPSPAFGGTEYPTMLAQRCMLVVQRDGKGELLRVGALEFSFGNPAERTKFPRARFSMQWERNLLDVQPTYLKEVVLGATVTHESPAVSLPPKALLASAAEHASGIGKLMSVPAYGYEGEREPEADVDLMGHLKKAFDAPAHRPAKGHLPFDILRLRRQVETRVELSLECEGTAVPKVSWFWIPDGSQAELPFDPGNVAGAEWGQPFGGPPFAVVTWEAPPSLLDEPAKVPSDLPFYSPQTEGKLILRGPIGVPKAKGQFFCRVTGGWGDFDMTGNPVEVEFISELSTDLSHKKVVPEKQFPTPGELGLGEGAGPGSLPVGWQDAPKDPVQWMGPGKDPVPTDMQKNMQETLDLIPGKGPHGL